MLKFFNARLLTTLLAFGYLAAQGCSAEKPTRYSSATKNGASKGSGNASGSKDKDKDLGDEDGKGNGSDNGDNDSIPKDPGDDDNTTMDPVVMDPIINDPIVKDPVPDPDPTPDPQVEIQKALEAACTPKTVKVINSNANEAHALFLSAFGNVEEDLRNIAKTDCLAMYRNANEMQFKPTIITVTIDNHDGVAHAYPKSAEGKIFFSSKHILNYKNAGKDAMKQEMWGVMAHEINHLYQNFWRDGKYTPFSEGLCDAIRADGLYYPKNRKVKGGNVYGSYTTTGFFLRYLRKKYDKDFYNKFNNAALSWNDNFWQKTLGKSVDELWADYQANGFDPNDW